MIVPTEKGITLSTGKFPVKYFLDLQFPENVTVLRETERKHFNGNLLNMTYKAHKTGETLRTAEEKI